MNKTTRTRLQFIVGAILFLSFAVAACNNDGEKKVTVKDEPVTTTTVTTVVRDSTDSMEKIKGGVSPVEETKPK
jgi:hypothetical protein